MYLREDDAARPGSRVGLLGAFRGFNETLDDDIPLVILCDSFNDETEGGPAGAGDAGWRHKGR